MIDRAMILLFAIAVFTLVVFNVTSTLKVSEDRERKDSLSTTLQIEKEHAKELMLLDQQHKRLATDFRMLEIGLRELYRAKCQRLNKFIPVFDDKIISHRIQKRSLFGYAIDTVFSVPTSGKHYLTVKATDDWPQATSGESNVKFCESYPLKPGSKHRVRLMKNDAEGKILMILDRKEIRFDSPFDRTIENTFYTLGNFSLGRVVSSPNQKIVQRLQSENPGEIERCILSYDTGNTSNNNRKRLLVQFIIESDGPTTSLPDDPYVVREMLDDYDAGKPPNYTFNPKGWYEFPE